MLHTYAMLNCAPDWVDDIDFSDAAVAKARLVMEFEGWSPDLLALLADSDTPLTPRKIFALPDDHRWPRVPGVTLLGDAAHLMAPNGEGANLAMLDGAELGLAIAAHPGNVEAALAAYERDLFPRSAAAATEIHVLLDLCLGPRTPNGLLDLFRGVEGRA